MFVLPLNRQERVEAGKTAMAGVRAAWAPLAFCTYDEVRRDVAAGEEMYMN